MTVKELKDLLSEYSDDLDVHFAFPSGDYWKTTLARPITSGELLPVQWSEYHREFSLPRNLDEIDPSPNGEGEVVVLR